MNLPFSFRQKIKIALSLFLIMVCTLLIRILEDQSIKNMGVAFASIYNDRLIPATDLFQVAEHMMAKSQILDVYLHQELSEPAVHTEQSLAKHNLEVDSLLKKYQSTFLVNPERGGLMELRKLIGENRKLEHAILATKSKVLPSTGQIDYEQQLNSSYSAIIKNLSGLIQIQSKVGENLIKESQQLMVGSKLYSALQFALAIIIGILVVSILYASNVIKIKTENFNLN
jgi:hypothetical protein